jgi:hypothetical protein
MRARKVESMFNSLNQQNQKMSNGKSKEQATIGSNWGRRGQQEGNN